MKFEGLLDNIIQLHLASQQAAGQTLLHLMNLRNWLVGAWIVEYEQGGEDRAEYGKKLMPNLAESLSLQGIQGFSASNLKNFRQVALAYPGFDPSSSASPLGLSSLISPLLPTGSSEEAEIRQTSGELESEKRQASGGLFLAFPSLQRRAQAEADLEWKDTDWLRRLFRALSFSHLLELSRVENPLQRAFYELHCLKEGWSIRELKRQKGSLLYERAGLSKDKEGLMALAREGKLLETPQTIIRDPYVLEFLGVASQTYLTESELEQGLLEQLQSFLFELGSGFCLMGRQYRITMGTNHYFLDLLFYHRDLRCLVAIDLKVEPFRHEHAGQMNFYVNYLAENVARPDENPPIGILLCTDKDAAEVHYATGHMEQSVFVSRYLVQLPSEERLAQWLQEERMLLEAREENHHG